MILIHCIHLFSFLSISCEDMFVVIPVLRSVIEDIMIIVHYSAGHGWEGIMFLVHSSTLHHLSLMRALYLYYIPLSACLSITDEGIMFVT